MKNNRGYFVVIEGPDGAGKTTVANLLVNKLNDREFDAIYCREPGGLPEGEKIRDIVLNYELSTEQRIMLFVASMSGNLEKIVKPALDEGKIVIMDRFIRSTYVYQGIMDHDKNIHGEDYFDTIDLYNDDLREQYRYKFINDLVKYSFKGVWPDIEYILKVTPEEAWERTHSRNKANDVFESKGFEYFKYINERYNQPIHIRQDDECIFINTTNTTPHLIVDTIYDSIMTMMCEDNRAYGD